MRGMRGMSLKKRFIWDGCVPSPDVQSSIICKRQRSIINFNSAINGCDRIYLTNNYFRLSCARWGCFGKQRWKICRADRRTVWPFVLTLDQPKGNATTISILFTTLQPRWRVIITDDGCRLWCWWCWLRWFAWVECSNVKRRLVSDPEILSNSISICKFTNFSYVS